MFRLKTSLGDRLSARLFENRAALALIQMPGFQPNDPFWYVIKLA